MRKPLVSVLATALVFCLVSCDKVKDAIKVNVPMQSADVNFSIPPQPAGTQALSEFTTMLNVDSLIKTKASNMGIDNIKSVKISSCTFTLLNAEGDNHFGVLSACKAELATNTNNTPVTLAEITNNPDASSSSLSLPVNSSLDLKNYFSGTTFYYKVSGTTRRATTTTLNCKASFKFDVQVGL